jgi:hypothetical protein
MNYEVTKWIKGTVDFLTISRKDYYSKKWTQYFEAEQEGRKLITGTEYLRSVWQLQYYSTKWIIITDYFSTKYNFYGRCMAECACGLVTEYLLLFVIMFQTQKYQG